MQDLPGLTAETARPLNLETNHLSNLQTHFDVVIVVWRKKKEGVKFG